MNSQVPEFNELPPDVRLQNVELDVICPLLAELVSFFTKWSPESYDGYYMACAIALVSIISARRVEYLLGGRRATSLYIILVDTSGLSAKTTVINLVQALVRSLNLYFLLLPDTITAQKLFLSMCIQVPKDFNNNNIEDQKKIIKNIQKNQAFNGQRGWIYDEFGKLIREMMQSSHYNSSFRELLKKLFDNKPELSNSTIVRDDEIILNPFLTLLGGMTPDDLAPHAKKGSALWKDGFLSRIAFICPSDDFRKDKWFPDGKLEIPKNIISKLQEYHKQLGEPRIQLSPKVEVIPAPGQLFEISGDVKKAFYVYRNFQKDMIESSEDRDLAGNYLRYPDMAIRIAVLIASLNNDSQVTLDQWAFAQNTTENWRRDLHRLYYQTLPNNNSANSSSKTDPKERIIELITQKGSLSSREIQQALHYKAPTVEMLLNDLRYYGKIKIIPSGKTYKFDVIVEDYLM